MDPSRLGGIQSPMGKIYNFNGFDGCVIQRRARSTGTLVGLYNGEQAGMDTDDGAAPWSIVCEVHGTILNHSSRKLAESHLSSPHDWCEDCGGRSVPMADRDALRDAAKGDEASLAVVYAMEMDDLDRAEKLIEKVPAEFAEAARKVIGEVRARAERAERCR